jgi:hypothetical protein
MRIKLAHQWTNRLRKLPESGMGYQRVDVRFANGQELRNVLVFNAEELDVPDKFAEAKIKDLNLHKP